LRLGSRCNSTLKTCAFSLAGWRMHQTEKLHQLRGTELVASASQPQVISCSSQSSARSFSSQTSVRSLPANIQDSRVSVLGGQSPQNDASLVLVRRDLHLNKQHQARYERDVANVVNSMTSLIADQQSDIDQLQHKVHDMTREIQGLKKNVELLRRKERQQRDVQPPPRRKATTNSYPCQRKPASRRVPVKAQGGQNKGMRFRINTIPHTTTSSKNSYKNTGMTDMDIFEKRFQLTGRE
jgi:hypothetical protein